MTDAVKIDILTGHKEIDKLHVILKIIFHCIFIEKTCIFTKLVQYSLKVKHILKRNFVDIFISETME